jgi:beta-lactamase regulating signal transducer with metallopeptidase domain
MAGLVLNHLWQSTLFAGIVALLTLSLRSNAARVRYRLWLAASLKFLVPFATLTAMGSAMLQSLMPSAVTPAVAVLKPVAEPFPPDAIVFSVMQVRGHAINDVAIRALLVLWAAGCLVMLVRWLQRWSELQRLLRQSTIYPSAAPIPVKLAPSMLEPGLVGILRPVILLPQGIDERLSSAEISAVLAHEICHLRGRDNFLAAAHMLVEAIFWFHPLVWWLGARLNEERERACDEDVLAAGQPPQIYAESILKVCKFYLRSPLDCAAGISGADLKRRMEAIMRNSLIRQLSLLKKGVLAATAVLMLALPLMLGIPVGIPMAMAQSSAPTPGSEAALRRQIDGWEQKKPPFAELAPAMAATYEKERDQSQRLIDSWGAFKSLKFRGKDGTRDVYNVEFEHGYSAWTIDLKDGKIAFLLFAPAIKRDDTGPSPGTQAALRSIIESSLRGQPSFDSLTPAAASAAQQQLPLINGDDFKQLGVLRELKFTEINPRGWDIFLATHENGTSSWTVAPLKDGKADGFSLSSFSLINVKPRPGTEGALRRYLEALQRGEPNYQDMVPSMAEAVRSQLPGILAAIRPLGAVRSITFKGRGLRDMDTYEVSFEHGTAEFRMGPLTADGKVERRGFTILNE